MITKRQNTSIHGFIEIEIIRKHGQRFVLHENLLTSFGKSFILSNGVGGLFGYGTDLSSNRIRTVGEGLYLPSAGTPVGPYLLNSESVYTDGSKITNLLLNNPSLAADKGLWLPNSDTLAGYAVADSPISGQLKEGTNAILKDSQKRSDRMTRRFSYGSDLACEFNCIAMSTAAPDNATGRIVPIFRSVQPVVYSDLYYYNKIQGLGLHKLQDGLVSFIGTDGTTRTLAPATGKITQDGVIQTEIYKQQIISVFSHGNYTYVVKAKPGMYAGSMKLSYDIIDSDGTIWQTFEFPNDWSASYYQGIVYYEGKFYFVNGYYNIWYELDESYGYLRFDRNMTTAAKIATPIGTYSVLGSDVTGFRNIGVTFTYNRNTPGSWYYDPTGFYMVDENLVQLGPAAAYTGGLFNIGNSVLSFEYSEQKDADWANKYEGLVEYGNLLSYHVLDTPIQKNVGDTMFITYSYAIV